MPGRPRNPQVQIESFGRIPVWRAGPPERLADQAEITRNLLAEGVNCVRVDHDDGDRAAQARMELAADQANPSFPALELFSDLSDVF
jgi:hypothetical protein